MEATLGKWGNSLALRIPREAELKMGLKDKEKVRVSFDNSTLVIAPKTNLPSSFEELWGDYPPVKIDLEISGVVGDEGCE